MTPARCSRWRHTHAGNLLLQSSTAIAFAIDRARARCGIWPSTATSRYRPTSRSRGATMTSPIVDDHTTWRWRRRCVDDVTTWRWRRRRRWRHDHVVRRRRHRSSWPHDVTMTSPVRRWRHDHVGADGRPVGRHVSAARQHSAWHAARAFSRCHFQPETRSGFADIHTFRRRRGVVVSGVRRMNEVNARLVPGWVTVFGRVYHLGM